VACIRRCVEVAAALGSGIVAVPAAAMNQRSTGTTGWSRGTMMIDDAILSAWQPRVLALLPCSSLSTGCPSLLASL
jgi:hypothetical protein